MKPEEIKTDFICMTDAARRLGMAYSTLLEQKKGADWLCLHRFKRRVGRRFVIPTIQLEDHIERVLTRGECAGGCALIAVAAIEAAKERIAERVRGALQVA